MIFFVSHDKIAARTVLLECNYVDMIYKKPVQKLILFTESEPDLDKIRNEMKNGWSIVNLVKHESHYVGIMEQLEHPLDEDGKESVFIPPRKKLRIST